MPRVKQSDDEQSIEEKFTSKLNNFKAFNYGLDGDYFAANFSTCAEHALSWWFYEVNTYKVKLKYASYDDTITNSTLFVQNFTNLLITCTDVVENIYYYGLNEATKFASGSDWALGLLQSLLGSILRLTDITGDLIQMNEQNITDVPKTLYYVGEILNLLLVFDPVSAEIQRL